MLSIGLRKYFVREEACLPSEIAGKPTDEHMIPDSLHFDCMISICRDDKIIRLYLHLKHTIVKRDDIQRPQMYTLLAHVYVTW